MRKYKFSNLIYQIVSIVLAIFIWFLVMGIVRPIVTDKVSFDVVIKNSESFVEQGKTFGIKGSKKVTITYDVRTDEASKINSSKFEAYVDANEYNLTGSLPIHVNVSNDVEKLLTNIRFEPQVVNVSSETMSSKQFYVYYNIKGELKNGKTVGSVITNPTTVYVNAPLKDLEKIKKVAINVDVDGRSSSFNGESKLIFYDEKGQEINNDNIYTVIKDIQYTVIVFENKTVSFNVLLSGELEEGLKCESIDIKPNTVKITGPRNILNSIYSIDIPEINLKNITETTVFDYNISDLLPQGIILTDENKIVVTTIVISNSKEDLNADYSQLDPSNGKIIIESNTKDPSGIIISPKKITDNEK